MTYKTLFLSDIEKDKLQELLKGTERTIEEGLYSLHIEMDTDRAENQLAEEDYFERCYICGKWDKTGGDELCWDCWQSTEGANSSEFVESGMQELELLACQL